MRRFLWVLRLLAGLSATFLAAWAWREGYTATREIAFSEIPHSPLFDSLNEASPDGLRRFVLLRFAQGCAFAFAALFFLQSVYRIELHPQRRTAANAVALTFFCCAGALLLQWSLGHTISAFYGVKSPYAVLASVHEFAGTAVGISGIEPESARAFRDLSARPLSTMAFLQLIGFGTPAGQVYGLCGLRRSAPALFRFVVRPFLHSRREVETVFGCVGSRVPMSQVVRAENGIRLTAGQTLQQWFVAHCALRKGCSPELTFDVFGGSYSSMFLDEERPPAALPGSPSS